MHADTSYVYNMSVVPHMNPSGGCLQKASRMRHLAADVDLVQVHRQGRMAAAGSHAAARLLRDVQVALVDRRALRDRQPRQDVCHLRHVTKPSEIMP